MGKAITYTATHDETGEEIYGTAGEVAAQLGVVAGTVYKMQIEGRKVSGHWIIKKNGQRGEKQPWKVPQSILDDWDALTGPVRKRKGDSGNEKKK